MSSFKFEPQYRPHTLAGQARPVGRPQRPLERPQRPLERPQRPLERLQRPLERPRRPPERPRRPPERPQGHLRGLKAGFQASRPASRLPEPSGPEIWLERGRQTTVWAHTLWKCRRGLPDAPGGPRTLQNPLKSMKNVDFHDFRGRGAPP